MDQSRFFEEVARLGKEHGFHVSRISNDGRLELSSGQHYLCRIDENGAVYYPEKNEAELEPFLPQVETVRKYVTAMEQAPPLQADGLGDGYVKLTEFEDTVLAGKDMGDRGFQFITWDWTHDHNGLNHGHYYEDYAAAKEDFAFRSGLAPEHQCFTPEQAAALHNIVCMALDNNLAQDAQETRCLEQCREKLEVAYPEIAERTPTPEQRPEPEITMTM